jgi:hypothetical protein
MVTTRSDSTGDFWNSLARTGKSRSSVNGRRASSRARSTNWSSDASAEPVESVIDSSMVSCGLTSSNPWFSSPTIRVRSASCRLMTVLRLCSRAPCSMGPAILMIGKRSPLPISRGRLGFRRSLPAEESAVAQFLESPQVSGACAGFKSV